MGNYFRKCFKCGLRYETIPILLIGLDNSGKTKIGTLLTKEHSKYEEYAPTQGSRYFELANYKGQHCIKITELGGTEDLRNIWKYYYLETFGVIFVIDSSDAGKLEESRMVFSQVICNEFIMGKPMLILANKQDIFGAVDSIDICEYFAIEKFANFYRTPCLLQETGSFLSPENGLDTGFSWLIQTIEQNLKSLKNRTAFHRKFSEETIPKRVTSSKKRKKTQLIEISDRPKTAPNQCNIVMPQMGREEQMPVESKSSHQSRSVIKVETSMFHKEEIIINAAEDVANIISTITLLSVDEKKVPNAEDMIIEDLSLNYSNVGVIKTIADIHNYSNSDTIKTL